MIYINTKIYNEKVKSKIKKLQKNIYVIPSYVSYKYKYFFMIK